MRQTQPENMPPNATVDSTLRFLRYLAAIAHQQAVYVLWRPFLHNAGDDMVLECAVSSGSRYIVTHNLRDFRWAVQLNVHAISPGEFLKLLRNPS